MKLAVLLISTLLLATGVEAGKKILHLGVALSMAAEHWPLAKPATVPSLDSVFRAIGLTEDEQVALLSSRCLVCRPSHLRVCAVSAPLRRVNA